MDEQTTIERINLGHASAYAYYKAGGGTGTEEEFTQWMADLGIQVEYLENMAVVTNTLEPGTPASATYEDGVLTLNIPKGEKGDPAPADEVAEATDAWLAENITNPSNPPLDRSLTLANAAAPADMVGDLKSAFGEETEAATVTQTLDGTELGGLTLSKVQDNPNEMTVYGVPSASRHLLFLNGQNALKSTSSEFSKTLDAGTYDIQIGCTGYKESASIRYTETTFGTYTALSNGIVTFEHDVMIGMYISSQQNWGSVETPTVVSFSAKKLSAVDMLARQELGTIPAGKTVPDLIAENVDNTLAISGKAADSETVGSRLSHMLQLSSSYSTTLENGTNIDELSTAGTYKVTSSSAAATMLGTPPIKSAAYVLIVCRTTQVSKTIQIAIVAGTNPNTNEYLAYRFNTNNIWEPWKKIATVDDVNTLRADVFGNLPSYYFSGSNYLDNRIDEIISHRHGMSVRSAELLFFTDPHFYRESVSVIDNGMNQVGLLSYIQQKTNIGNVVCGGDLMSGQTMPLDDCLDLLKATREHLNPIWGNLHMIVGNHEWNNPGNKDSQMANMTDLSDIYKSIIGDKEIEYSSIDTTCGSYTMDDKAQKILYIYLGTNYGGNIVFNQFKWFVNDVLSNIPDGYAVVVLSHIGLDSSSDYIGRVGELVGFLDAANTGGTYSYQYPGTSNPITADFTGKSIKVCCIISGHIHEDLYKFSDSGIPIIATTCDRGPTNTSSIAFNSLRSFGGVYEQAIDAVQIDIENDIIRTTRIGGTFGDYVAPDYKETNSSPTTFAVGDYCGYDGQIWRCIESTTDGVTWDATKWAKSNIIPCSIDRTFANGHVTTHYVGDIEIEVNEFAFLPFTLDGAITLTSSDEAIVDQAVVAPDEPNYDIVGVAVGKCQITGTDASGNTEIFDISVVSGT